MKIAHVVSAFPDRVTGPRNSVTLLSKNLNLINGVESRVYTDVANDGFFFNGERVYPLEGISVEEYDVVVFSSVYNKSSVFLAKECRGKGVPYIISPRASLIKASIYKSWWKKILFLYGYGRAYLKDCMALHFLTEEEREFSLCKNKRSFVVGNIVVSTNGDDKKKEKVIGFLGRYDIKHKGLDVLFEGIVRAKASIERSGWKVVLHGPDFKGGKQLLEKKIEEEKLGDIVFVRDALHGAEKDDFFDRSSIFVHTSRYEGQPQSVMEAMTRRCALMVTPGTNMGGIVKESFCGELVEFTPDSIACFFSSLPRNVSELKLLQDRAREYALEKFDGAVVARAFYLNLSVLLNGEESVGVS